MIHLINIHCCLSISFDQGRIFRDLRLPGMSPVERTALYVAAVEVLAKLHSLDVASLNLEGYGRGAGYCKRQVRYNLVHQNIFKHLIWKTYS